MHVVVVVGGQSPTVRFQWNESGTIQACGVVEKEEGEKRWKRYGGRGANTKGIDPSFYGHGKQRKKRRRGTLFELAVGSRNTSSW